MLILKAYSSTSHILFMLRCSPYLGNAILSQIDEVLKSNIRQITNVVLSDGQWIQASLPVKAGGLGICRAFSLALSAYLVSAYSTTSLQVEMCGNDFFDPIISHTHDCILIPFP